MSPFRLAVSAEMVFLDLPITERVRRIADLGFEVEIWDWTTKDIDALTRTGARFSSMTGYVRGTLADPDGAEELLRTAERSLRTAERLDCPRLNVHGTGLDDKGLPVVPAVVVTPAMWLQAARTLTRLAELGERAGRVFTLENLNTAGYTGVVGLEAWASGDSVQALERFRAAFTIPAPPSRPA